LRDVETTLGEVPTFDPATMRRQFVLGTWDGISVTLLPRLLARVGAEAPGVDLDLRPVGRAGSARELEDGVVDLTIEVRPAESPGLKQRALAKDHLVCVVRADHPEVGETLDLETYLRLPHALISPQGAGPGAVDTLLIARGLSRRVALRIRYFLAAPLIVAESDLILTAPASVARAFAKMAPLRLLTPPLDIPSYTTSMVWHERSDGDPGHAWLREAVVAGMAVEPG
jgi:DNA-binding transcriptional LysR family regulator